MFSFYFDTVGVPPSKPILSSVRFDAMRSVASMCPPSPISLLFHCRTLSATYVLLEYLTESAISPLMAAFVESDDPLASRSVLEQRISMLGLLVPSVGRCQGAEFS